ncbi:MAG: hypothetical protein HOP19_06125 [Acidobacteria bacterium]|nr:hypothetical protein [Acidobacteriota bacterium]
MTNQETLMLTNLRRERQQQLVRQLAVNADIRRRWAEPDHLEAQPGRVANDGAILSDYFSRDRFLFKLLKAPREISPLATLPPAIAWITSLLFVWRSKQTQVTARIDAKTTGSPAPLFLQ